MNRYALPLIGVVVMIPILILGLQSDPSKLPSQYVGKPAPEFSLSTLKDASRTLSSSDLVGRVSLVNIWGTWCAGCRAEHGFLMQLAEQQQFPIYGINWRDDRQEALKWLQQYGDPYVASGFDQDGRVGIDWGAYGAPETFLISPEGHVLHRFPGPLNQSVWDKEFAPLIAGLAEVSQ